jgi:hypothetical protein
VRDVDAVQVDIQLTVRRPRGIACEQDFYIVPLAAGESRTWNQILMIPAVTIGLSDHALKCHLGAEGTAACPLSLEYEQGIASHPDVAVLVDTGIVALPVRGVFDPIAEVENTGTIGRYLGILRR